MLDVDAWGKKRITNHIMEALVFFPLFLFGDHYCFIFPLSLQVCPRPHAGARPTG